MAGKPLDDFLLSELIAGNERAFDKVFHSCYDNLCRFSNTIVHDEDLAQSLVQNVFVKLWEKRETLGNVDHLQRYLVSMVRNESINYLNREKRNVRVGELPESPVEPTAETDIKAGEFTERLVLAFSELPERCRQAFEYSRYDRLTNREIAGKMGISQKAVEALITRSLKQIRVKLREFLPSGRNLKLPGDLLFLFMRRVKRIF